MSTWFECKVKYQKTDEKGVEKNVNELYLIDAVSFTEAESRINQEMEPYISGEFNVTNIKVANYAELQPNENGDRWFKCRVSFIALDEKKGTEKKTNSNFLVQANDVKHAFECVTESMKGSVSDYTIPSINESTILDVFPYFSGEEEDVNTEIPENLKPIGDISEN